MGEWARVALVLGDDIMNTFSKDIVIARLIATKWPAEDRARWYRMWCDAVGVFCSSVDLKRAKEGRRRELNRPLPLESRR